MNATNISVFPGQGAQFTGMGKGLFDEFSTHVQIADDVLGYSIRDLCLEDKNGQLNNTAFTQPALYVVNILHYLKFIEETPNPPDVLAGHSLGEYCALFAAGAYGFETGLRLVQERGRLMSTCREGTMAAVLGLDIDSVEELLAQLTGTGVQIANLNTRRQTVLSGNRHGLERLETRIVELGGSWHWLNVSGAFHSSLMDEAAVQFREFLSKVRFYPLQVTVVANATAKPYPTHDGDATINLLATQLNSPVQWSRSMELVSAKPDRMFEHGPAPVLTRMIEQSHH